MFNQEENNKIGLSNSKIPGMKFPQKKIKSKELGNISLDLSKEEEIMRKTPGLMENSMIENITTMNSIFAQKQSERLILNNFNQLNNISNTSDSHSNSINNSNQTFNALVNSDLSRTNNTGENPLDMAVIIKDSSEIKEEEKKKKKIKKKNRKKKKKSFNKMTFLIIFLLIIIILLIIGLIMTYISVAKDR